MLILSLIIVTLLVVATLVIKLRINSHPSEELINNQRRIYTWWLIAFVCIPVLYIGDWALSLLVFILIIWAAFEFARIQNKPLNLLKGTMLLALAIAYSVFLKRYPDIGYVFLFVPGIVLFLFFSLTGRTGAHSLFLFVFCITSIESILVISQQSARAGYDSGLILLFLFLIISLNDIFQYLTGSLLGRKPLATRISPNKTIEGAIGGIVLTAIVAIILMPLIMSVTWWIAALIGGLIALLGILGDLSVSAIKRKANIKNTGASLPGHGGLLDRIDSLTLAAPGFGLYLYTLS